MFTSTHTEVFVGAERSVRIDLFVAAAVLCAVALAQPLQAQGAVTAGQTVSGRLDASDYVRDSDTTYYDDWFYEGRAGEQITVTQRSSDFDSWLLIGRVVNGAFQLDEYNDDGAGGNDSRITYTLPASARYVIRVNVVGRGRTGAYTLRVDRVGAPVGGGGVVRATGNRVLSAGQSYTGELDGSDPEWTDDTFYELWRYLGRAGEQLVITMRSPSFRSYIQYGRMDGNEFTYLGGSTSRTVGGQQETVLDVTFAETGEYGIRANSHGRHTGPYTLSVASGLSSASAPSTPAALSSGKISAGTSSGGTVGSNQTVSGQLDSSDPALADGTFYDLWRFQGRAGQRIRVTLRSSDFDAYVAFGSMSGGEFEAVETDDDSAGGTDAMIELTLTASGEYAIRANSLSKATGRYTLTVETQ